MVLTRRDVVRMGLASAGALALGGRARAAGSFHLGLVTYNVAKDWDLETLLRLVREAGLEGVEFRTTHAHGVERTLTPAQRAEVKKKCADAGLLQTSLGTVCEFHSPDPAVVRKNVEDCREWVLLAKDIGARGVKVRPNGLPKDVPEEKTLEQIGRALAECGAFATDHGVEIWVEVHGDQTKVPARMRRIMDVCSPPERRPDLELERHRRRRRLGRRVLRAPAALRPLLPHHRPAERLSLPRALLALLRQSGFTGFTLCEFPRAGARVERGHLARATTGPAGRR